MNQKAYPTRLTTTGMTLGMVPYDAPELAQGAMVTPDADVYALGMVMYEMLTGRTPFDGSSPLEVAMQHTQDPLASPSLYNPKLLQTWKRLLFHPCRPGNRGRWNARGGRTALSCADQ
jgi:serine/threonine protein kinase